MEFILNPWPWYVSGPLIALVLALLLYFGKTFGMSSNLRTLCTIGGAGKYADFFKIRWQDYSWNLIVLIGAIIGGFVAANYLSNETVTIINPNTISELNELGLENIGSSLVPSEVFAIENLASIKNLAILIVGGLLVGFGTRYAGGCTSGHAITGLSSLQKPSLIAVIGFFAGGLIMVNFILPLIL